MHRRYRLNTPTIHLEMFISGATINTRRGGRSVRLEGAGVEEGATKLLDGPLSRRHKQVDGSGPPLRPDLSH
jgi:hypothetical protein